MKATTPKSRKNWILCFLLSKNSENKPSSKKANPVENNIVLEEKLIVEKGMIVNLSNNPINTMPSP